jgi:hypothetical protein
MQWCLKIYRQNASQEVTGGGISLPWFLTSRLIATVEPTPQIISERWGLCNGDYVTSYPSWCDKPTTLHQPVKDSFTSGHIESSEVTPF